MLTPTERHRTGLSLRTAATAVLFVVVGVVASVRGSWIGPASFGVAAILAREVYLSYKAGNFP
jgi:hypothetical protein